jgi:hypothetical protein
MRKLLSRSLTLYTNNSLNDEASRCIQMKCNILRSLKLTNILKESHRVFYRTLGELVI